MPRSNRPRGRRLEAGDDGELDLGRALIARFHTEPRRDGIWNVQPISAASAAKIYTCPGCGLDIQPGTAHTVTWRADGIMGETDDLAGRRHWHAHCWKIRP
ncbi:MAG: hypothetical protein ABJA94_02500 [Rhodoglobus sp.]